LSQKPSLNALFFLFKAGPKGGYTIGRNFNVKNLEIFSEHNAKTFDCKFLTALPRNPTSTEIISLGYDVNDHVYSIAKSVNFVISQKCNCQYTVKVFHLDQRGIIVFLKRINVDIDMLKDF